MINTNFAQELKDQVVGKVYTPADSEYEQARLPWNRSYSPRPALVVQPESVADVVAAVRFARDNHLGVAAQTTGHGPQASSDDALLIVMSKLNHVQVDAQAQTARIEGGAVWQNVLDQALPHGLAPLLGSAPHVGVVGYTLGGGLGWLGRKYGLAADSVRSVDLVTADGALVHASADENADLFWGLRGAGGNFGVVTAIEISLYPVAELYGGFMVYPGALAAEALGFYRDWLKTVPDELTSSFAIFNFPDLPFLPEAIRGQTQVIVRAGFVGAAADGAAQIQKWLDWRAPLANTFRLMPFAEIATINNDPVQPSAGYASNGMFDDLSDEAIAIIVRRASDKSSPVVMHELRHAGGAISRVAADANAIGNRDAQFYFTLGGPLFPPNNKDTVAAAIRAYKAELQSSFRSGVYLNFMSAGEAGERVREAYGAGALDRLLTLKAKYDPDNTFRFAYPLTAPETTTA